MLYKTLESLIEKTRLANKDMQFFLGMIIKEQKYSKRNIEREFCNILDAISLFSV